MSAYYDRRLSPPMMSLLSGPLAWLLADVRGEWGETWGAHLQTRLSDGSPERIQLYAGRESPLYVSQAKGGFVVDVGDGKSRPPRPGFFKLAMSSGQLAEYGPELKAWLAEAMASLNPSFNEKPEARAQVGMVRRYGLNYRAGEPLLVLDTEAQVGFRGGRNGSGTQEKDALKLELEKKGIGWHQKLDVLGLLPSGRVALVEIKGSPRDLVKAVEQVLCYQSLFLRVQASDGLSARELGSWISQKRKAGLLPRTRTPIPETGPPVPVVALPDPEADGWADRWRATIAPLMEQHAGALAELQFLRLSPEGEILERAPA